MASTKDTADIETDMDGQTDRWLCLPLQFWELRKARLFPACQRFPVVAVPGRCVLAAAHMSLFRYRFSSHGIISNFNIQEMLSPSSLLCSLLPAGTIASLVPLIVPLISRTWPLAAQLHLSGRQPVLTWHLPGTCWTCSYLRADRHSPPLPPALPARRRGTRKMRRSTPQPSCPHGSPWLTSASVLGSQLLFLWNGNKIKTHFTRWRELSKGRVEVLVKIVEHMNLIEVIVFLNSYFKQRILTRGLQSTPSHSATIAWWRLWACGRFWLTWPVCLTRACSPGLGGSLSYCLETIWARGFGAVLASPWTTAQCASVLSASAPGP